MTPARRSRCCSGCSRLTAAFALGRPQGYVRIFADEGEPIRSLLTQLPDAWVGQQDPAGAVGSGYLATLLRACGPAGGTLPQGRLAAAPSGLAEPLTSRELEVLRLLAAGKSNQRIAHDLVVALGTVDPPR